MVSVNSPLNASNLNSRTGSVITGIDPSDQSGYSVSGAGDVNGDGIDDVIISAPFADGGENELGNSGESYVIFGNSDFGGEGSSFNPSSLNGSNGFIIYGATSGEQLGKSVSGIGDVNNDGIDDLIISANNNNTLERLAVSSSSDIDKTYIVFGNKNIGSSGTISLANLSINNGFTVEGIDGGEGTNIDVSYAGDFNNDGIDDFIIGAPGTDFEAGDAGAAYVVFGGSNVGGETGSVNISSLNGTSGFSIIYDNTDFGRAGYSVSNAGDMNGDGIDDVIIGVPYSDRQFGGGESNSNAGKAYVVYGRSNISPGSGTINLSSIDGSNGFVVRSSNSNDNLGWSVSGIGDINDDGMDDVIIGSPNADEPNERGEIGKSYVIFGGSNIGGETGIIDVSSINGTNGFTIEGANELDYSGLSVSGLGDVNDDGIDDVIIGEGGENSTTSDAYVVYGSKKIGKTGKLLLSELNGKNGFVVNGINSDNESGINVSGVGHVNYDGVNDLIIGSPTADSDNEGGSKGRSYVIYGSLDIDFAINDMDGDNKADIIVRDPNNDNNSWLKMNRATVTNNKGVGAVNNRGWRVKKTADFNGDGKGDYLWRNRVTGGVGLWTTDGNNITNKNSIGTVADKYWKIAEAADFDGDGKDDVLWRNHKTGENALWLMDGMMVKSYNFIPQVSTDWKIAAAKDFDGDNKADILWRNHKTGENALWFMDGAMVKSYNFVTGLNDMDWKIEAAADFDGDGKADMLWRNHDNGKNAIWSMDGAMVKSYDFIPDIVDTEWEIKGAADFGGNEKADIFWVKDDQYALWEMNGAAVEEYSFINYQQFLA